MDDRYIFNEQLKRIEPKETLCIYCRKQHSQSMDSNFFTKLFQEKDRTELIVYRSVKFNSISIGIPRCTSCYTIHSNCKSKAWMYSIAIALLIVILSFYFFGPMGILSVFIAFVLLFMLQSVIADVLVKKYGILIERDGPKKDILVRELVLSGWSLSPPSV